MTSGEQRPGDAARRALRAARERAQAERDSGAPGTPETRPPAPSGDKAVPAPEAPIGTHREAPEPAATQPRAHLQAPDTAEAPSEAAEDRPAAEAPRPGDIARAALRAAVAAARSTGRDEAAAAWAEEGPRAGGADDAGEARAAGTAGTEPAAGDAAR